ncbi:dynein associated protein-domain-containing protein [Melampsora americana]|nr:dynein associated protein-domain-containing protein [Melampsora americana]
MASKLINFKQGDRVAVAAGEGTAAYVGTTEFSNGVWIGIVLDEPNGKNDGSVNGKRYFMCKSGCGVFVRPSQVTLVTGSKPMTRQISSSKPPQTPQAAIRPIAANTNPSTLTRPGLQPGKSTHLTASQAPRAGRLSNVTSPNPTPSSPGSRGVSMSSRTPLVKTSSARTSSVNVNRTSTLSSLSKYPQSGPSSPLLSRVNSSSTASSKVGIAGTTMKSTTSVTSPIAMRRQSSGVGGNIRRAIPSPAKQSSFKLDPPVKPPSSINMARNSSQALSRATSHETSTSLFEEDPLEAVDSDDDANYGGIDDPDATPSKRHRKPRIDMPSSSELVTSPDLDVSPVLGTTIPNLSVVEDHFSLNSARSPKENKTPSRPPPDGTHSGSPYPNTVSSRTYEELMTKYKLMEARRNEDRDRIRELEKVKEDTEDWNNVVKPKLQAKLNECTEEIKALKKLNKELEASQQEAENRLADFSDEVELATLDKEMAEERLDQTEVLMVTMKEELENLKVELSALKEIQERIENGDANESDQTSTLKMIQLEKQNNRLKEALARMRDLSHEADLASRKKISDLEQELDLSAELQGEYSVLMNELSIAESQIEELKQQLDDAMGAEDMLEQLTERNLTLNEKLDDMKMIIEDLEALKELADELEENHVETEKQMQEEIDFKDLQLREQRKRNESLEESVADYENTILQFRELVMSLQTDLEAMRERQQIQHNESQTLASQTQAMLNLNMKLQNSSIKGQVKAIDLELRKLESTQAVLQCTIMKPYLLPAYFEADHDSVESLMFFTRLAAKAELVSSVIENTNNISESLTTSVTEIVVIACETRSKLVRLSALASRFAAFMRFCPPESFIKMGGVYQELMSVEKKMDIFIDACRKEELKEAEVSREVERFIPQMRHLAELYLSDTEYDVAELQCGDIQTLDVDLDSILACIGFTKQTIATIEKDGQTDVDDYLSDILFRPLQNLIHQARTAKVISKKLLRRLQDLMKQSSSLNPNNSNAMAVLKDNTYDLANVSSRLADLVGRYCSGLRSSKETFSLETYNDIIQEATRDVVKHTSRPLEEFFTLLSHLARDLGITLGVAQDPDHVAKNFFEHPWIARVSEMRSSAAINVDAELKVSKLNEEIRELVKDARAKDHTLQESQVKIQIMEKRMEAVKKQAEAMTELESSLKTALTRSKEYEDLSDSLRTENEKMAEENKQLKVKAAAAGVDANKAATQSAVNSPKHQGGLLSGQDFYVPYEGNLETTQLVEQIESLRGATRFLRAENYYLKSQGLLKQLNTLPSYSVLPPSFPPVLGGDSDPGSTEPKSDTDPSSPFDSNYRPNMSRAEQLRKMTSESKRLYKEALTISAHPRVVDLTQVKRRNVTAANLEPSSEYSQSESRPKTGRVWQLKERLPQVQFDRRKEEVERLRKKIEAFKERTRELC